MESKERIVYCFGYSRKSPDDKQGIETSINNQNDLIRSVCSSKKWRLISIEEDKDISGGDRNRRGLLIQIKKSIEFKKQNPQFIVYILLKDSKRFARDSVYSIETLKKLDSNGIGVFSIMKNSLLDYTDIGDRLIGVVDEQTIFDAKKYAKVTEDMKVYKSLPCIPAPFGYQYNKDKNWELVNKESKIVQGVVLDYVNRRDYRATIKDLKINKSKYYRIIKNTKSGRYSGILSYKNRNYTGTYSPIISKELFEKVQN